jgi:hypothetical protein
MSFDPLAIYDVFVTVDNGPRMTQRVRGDYLSTQLKQLLFAQSGTFSNTSSFNFQTHSLITFYLIQIYWLSIVSPFVSIRTISTTSSHWPNKV